MHQTKSSRKLRNKKPQKSLLQADKRVTMLSSIAFRFSRSPRDAVAVLVAAAGVTAIFCNALFMQRGPHPAPIFSYRSSPPAKAAPPQPTAHRADTAVLPQNSPAHHTNGSAQTAEKPSGDPIGDLVNKTNRVVAVQHALSDFGYGQIHATGVMTRQTKIAVERFQRARGLRVTGQINDETVAAIDAMTGQALPK